jgi:hypothetical protein
MNEEDSTINEFCHALVISTSPLLAADLFTLVPEAMLLCSHNEVDRWRIHASCHQRHGAAIRGWARRLRNTYLCFGIYPFLIKDPLLVPSENCSCWCLVDCCLICGKGVEEALPNEERKIYRHWCSLAWRQDFESITGNETLLVVVSLLLVGLDLLALPRPSSTARLENHFNVLAANESQMK